MSASENKANTSTGDRGDAPSEVNGLTSANGTGVFSKSENAVSSAPGNTLDYGNQESMVYMSPQGMPYQYSPFASVDGSWGATGQYDPSLLAALQFNVMQQPFYFPGAGDIWGQDTGNVLMNYPLLSPVSLDQPAPVQNNSEVLTENSTAAQPAPAVVDNSGLAGSFSGLMLNGGVQGVMAVGPTNVLPTVPVENIVAPAVGTPVPVQNTAPQPEKPKSWAAIASQPAKPRPPKPPPQPEPQVVETTPPARKAAPRGSSNSQSKPTTGAAASNGKPGPRKTTQPQATTTARTANKGHQSELVGKLLSENKYNPSDFTMNLTNARFFVIKSYAEDDIHRSIKYSIWTSTEHGNRRLNQAYQEQQKAKGNVYLLFSVNGSGHFCGVAQMTSEVDTNTSTGVWAQDKWKGRFDVKWIYVKDVPNSHLRHIRLENNENKPVTNSRDTQEVPLPKAKQVMKLIHTYAHTTSIFDDFDHYEKKQEEESGKSAHS